MNTATAECGQLTKSSIELCSFDDVVLTSSFIDELETAFQANCFNAGALHIAGGKKTFSSYG